MKPIDGVCHVGKQILPYLLSYTDLYTIPGFILSLCYFFLLQPRLRLLLRVSPWAFHSQVLPFRGLDPSGMIQPECRTVLLRVGSVRGPGSSCDHWLLGRCCSFSTMIPGTAPRRCTSPTHGDASRRTIPTTVHKHTAGTARFIRPGLRMKNGWSEEGRCFIYDPLQLDKIIWLEMTRWDVLIPSQWKKEVIKNRIWWHKASINIEYQWKYHYLLIRMIYLKFQLQNWHSSSSWLMLSPNVNQLIISWMCT